MFREEISIRPIWRRHIPPFIPDPKHYEIILIPYIQLHPVSILNFSDLLIEFIIIIIINIDSKSRFNHLLSCKHDLLFSTSIHEEVVDETEDYGCYHDGLLHYLIDSLVACVLR